MSKKFSFSTRKESRSTFFKNKAVLKPNYRLESLEDILHRDEEINQYIDYMMDATEGCSPSNLFLYGKPGLGKTLMTELVMEQLKLEAGANGVDVCVVMINCDENKNEIGIVTELIRQLPTPPGEEKHFPRYSLSYYNAYCRKLINAYPGVIIVVFDELDKAKQPEEVINRLLRITSETSKLPPTIIGITNDAKLRDTFETHIKSMLGENSLFIDPYDADQIADILRARAAEAFEPDVVDDIAIQITAALAAQESGDVRKGIELLRVAGEIAVRKGHSTVTEDDVREADDQIEIDKVLKSFRKLPVQSKTTLLACIKVDGSGCGSDTNTIYTVYRRLTDYVCIDKLTLRRVNDLMNELAFLGIIEMEKKSRGRNGMSRKVVKINSKLQIMKELEADSRFYDATQMPRSVFAQMFF